MIVAGVILAFVIGGCIGAAIIGIIEYINGND